MAIKRNAEQAHRESVEHARGLRELIGRYGFDMPKDMALKLLDEFDAALRREARMRAIVVGMTGLFEKDPTKESWQNIPAFKTLAQTGAAALDEYDA